MEARETVVEWRAPPLKLGVGAAEEIGHDVAALGARRALLVTDRGVERTGLPERVRSHLERAGVEAVVYADARVEPSDRSVAAAAAEVADVRFDCVVAVGGGSAIDTAKLVNLLVRHPGDPLRFVAPPTGGGERVPAPLPPLAALPTTAGTGSESSQNAVLELAGRGRKTAVSDPLLRPRLAVVDPELTYGCPAAVTRAAGLDVLVQSLESYTTRPYDERPRPAHPGQRGGYVGANPISDVWSERALELVARHLVRAVRDGGDLEARIGMAQAAVFARLSNAGAHVPHALGYAVASLVRDHVPAGYGVDHPLVPHGESVAVVAPAAFAFTHAAAPARHERAARLLGGASLPETVGRLLAELGAPARLRDLGYRTGDVPALVERALEEQRLLRGAPCAVSGGDLEAIVRAAL